MSTRQQAGTRGTFVSISEVASIYQVHPGTVRRWIAEGRIDAQRVGVRLIRLDLESVYQRLGRPTPQTS
ncbi:helix-turn-helix domain-containing protein [Gordonia sp. 1D]|uniref:helix-turn-helix domain-containing protein n=1 Tax=Gordonia sp. 1D TaxID=1737359 RepID=UPI0012FD0335|nr:helix-turn-helix domain-containing protein [Gordonia sp. 1D]